MPNRAMKGLTLLSAVVCLLSLLLVGRSVFCLDALSVPIAPRRGYSASILDGQLRLWNHDGTSFGYRSYPAAVWRRGESVRWQHDIAGVRWVIGWGSHGLLDQFRFLILPLWLLPLLTAIPPVR